MRLKVRLSLLSLALCLAGAVYAVPGYYPPSEFPRDDPAGPRMGSPDYRPGFPDIKTQDRYNEAVSDWIIDSNRRVASLKGDTEVLKQKVAELEKQLAALKQQPGNNPDPTPGGGSEARLKALEDRVAKLEAAGTTLKAPLTVSGAGGKPILKLSADGYLLLGSDGGSQVALIAQPGAPAKVGVQSGAYAVQLSAGNGKALVDVLNTETQTVSLVAANDQVGLTVEKDGKTAAGVGSVPGKGVALRLYDKSGRTVAAAGENPSTAGTGIVYVGNGSKNSAALAANSDGSGVVHAFASDGTVGAGLIGAERLVGAYNKAGNAVVTIGKSENSEGGNVTSRDPNGEGVFRAGYRSDIGGGEACVNRVKKSRTICLGLSAGGMQ